MYGPFKYLQQGTNIILSQTIFIYKLPTMLFSRISPVWSKRKVYGHVGNLEKKIFEQGVHRVE